MSNSEIAVAILVMGVVTYLTRVGGIWLVAFVPVTGKVERFLHHLSGSVLAALTVSVAFSGDAARAAGVGAACVAMLITRNALASLAVGTLFAVIVRYVAA